MDIDWDFLWSLDSSTHRDLAWLIQAPSLLATTENMSVISSQEYVQWFDAARDWLEEEDRLSFHLQGKVNSGRRHKLGLYAEDLVLHFFEAHPFYELLIHDLQIFIEKRCIGAMDFVVRNKKTGEIEHWEMAIKFYLQLEPSRDWSDFVGPSGKDSMQRKLGKMLGKQLPLSLREETKNRLAELDIPAPTTRRILSKGMLFGQWNTEFQAPEGTDPNQPLGTWIRRKDFVTQFIFSGKRWKIRRHPHWIAPYLTRDESELLGTEEVMEAPLERDRFLMISEMEPCVQGWQEVHRWIVVIDDWERMEG